MRSHVTIWSRSYDPAREEFQYRKRYEVTCDDTNISANSALVQYVSIPQAVWGHMWHWKDVIKMAEQKSFNTASGMRSHVTKLKGDEEMSKDKVSIPQAVWGHMWRRRRMSASSRISSFNTASGMRSHVTRRDGLYGYQTFVFQYRKRYEVTCDINLPLPTDCKV